MTGATRMELAMHVLADASNTAVSSTLIATAGTVIAAGIAAVAAAFHRSAGAEDNTPVLGLTQAYLDELIRRATAAETQCEATTDENERLRRLLLDHHINPETGKTL